MPNLRQKNRLGFLCWRGGVHRLQFLLWKSEKPSAHWRRNNFRFHFCVRLHPPREREIKMKMGLPSWVAPFFILRPGQFFFDFLKIPLDILGSLCYTIITEGEGTASRPVRGKQYKGYWNGYLKQAPPKPFSFDFFFTPFLFHFLRRCPHRFWWGHLCISAARCRASSGRGVRHFARPAVCTILRPIFCAKLPLDFFPKCAIMAL